MTWQKWGVTNNMKLYRRICTKAQEKEGETKQNKIEQNKTKCAAEAMDGSTGHLSSSMFSVPKLFGGFQFRLLTEQH